MAKFFNTTEISGKLQSLVAHPEGVNAVKIGPVSGQVFATGGEDKKINLWRIGRPSCLLSIKAAKSSVKSVCFDPEEKVIAGGSLSGSLHLFALEAEGKTRCRLSGHKAECSTLTFHPLGNMIASGSVDTQAKLWDIRNKSCVRSFMGHSDTVSCAEFSPDGRWLATGSNDKTVRLWDLQSGKVLHEFSNNRGGGITSVKFHPDEFWLASSSLDGTVKYFDLETFRLVGSTPTDRGAAVRSITFLGQDGNSAQERRNRHSLVSATDEGVKIWKWQPCRCIAAEPTGWGSVGDTHISKDKHGDQRLIACNFKEKSMVSVWSVNLSILSNNRQQESDEDSDREEVDERQEGRMVDVLQLKDKRSRLESKQRELFPVNKRAEEETSFPDEQQEYENDFEVDDAEEEDQSVEEVEECIDDTCAPETSEEKMETLVEHKVEESVESSHNKKENDGGGGRNNSARDERKSSIDKPKTAHPSSTKVHDEHDSKTRPKSCATESGGKPTKRVIPRLQRKKEDKSEREEAQIRRGVSDGNGRQRALVGCLANCDSPLDLSISEFMLRPNSGMIKSKTIRAEMKTAIAEEMLVGHAKFQTVMQERLEELEHVISMWSDGDTVAALEYIDHLGNESVSYDVLKFANLRNGQHATLDVCAAALPSLITLVESHFEDHIKLSLATSKFLFDSFSEIVFSTLDYHYKHNRGSGSARGSVDVSREERVAKCMRCFAGFKDLGESVTKLMQVPAANQVARTRKEAQNLHDKLEKFILRIEASAGTRLV